VPAIGRIMNFSLLENGKPPSSPLWNNPRIDSGLKADAEGWTNYGGDKAWPAPQSDWPKVIGREWPPPKGFDATPYTASIKGETVELVSAVDPSYGIRMRRSILLDPSLPTMTITTTFEKVEGPTVHVGVWTITQLNSPERAFILLPEHSSFPEGYKKLFPDAPADLRLDGRLLSLTRHPAKNTLIGNDGTALLWVGDGPDLLVEPVKTASEGEYPNGTRARIYTNSGDELPYIELETLDRLQDLKPGNQAEVTTRYTLIPRTERAALAEAKKVFEEH
jgi:hypothetical protein